MENVSATLRFFYLFLQKKGIVSISNSFLHYFRYAVVAADGAGLRPVVGDSNAGSRPDGKIQPGENFSV
jgi:hypothetical protein